MPTPAPAWNQVRVYGTWLGMDGSKKAGTYTVTIPQRVVSTTDDVIIPAGEFTSGSLSVANGVPSLDVMLPAVDDPDITPRGWSMRLVVTFTGGSPAETFDISPTLAAGALNLRTVVVPTTPTAPPNLAYIGVAGGVAKLDTDGDVVNAAGTKVGGGGATTVAGLTDSTTVGRALVKATDAAAARAAIGAGTSSLALGTTGSTAKAGDYAPPAATSSVSGLVRLTGDLGGTATLPTVPGLADKQDASALHLLSQLAPGSSIVIDYYKAVYGAANAWPASRPTNRTDIDVTWRGPTDPGAIMLAGDILDLTGP